jgi:hypothetical protein
MSIEAFIAAVAPAAAGIVAVTSSHRTSVRRTAIALVLFSATMIVGVLLQADHIAATHHSAPQSVEWQRGARDTRRAAGAILPTLGSSLVALTLLVFVPPKR